MVSTIQWISITQLVCTVQLVPLSGFETDWDQILQVCLCQSQQRVDYWRFWLLSLSLAQVSLCVRTWSRTWWGKQVSAAGWAAPGCSEFCWIVANRQVLFPLEIFGLLCKQVPVWVSAGHQRPCPCRWIKLHGILPIQMGSCKLNWSRLVLLGGSGRVDLHGLAPHSLSSLMVESGLGPCLCGLVPCLLFSLSSWIMVVDKSLGPRQFGS